MSPAQEERKRWVAKLSLLKLFQRNSKSTTLQAPSVQCGVPYLYKPLPQGYIRLLTIKSSKGKPATYRLVTYKQRRAPKYDAVSYCWGEDLTGTIINCDGADLRIRKSLSIALSYLANRPKSARPLWIDAICLNQEDKDEKAIHVPLMHEIYKHASRTIVWLGEPDEDTDMALDFMAEMISHLKHGGDPKATKPPNREREWKALREYLQRPWFNRLWALQEVLLSKTTEILCSSKKMRVLKWQTLENFLDFLGERKLLAGLINTSIRGYSTIYFNVARVKALRLHFKKYGHISSSRLLLSCMNRSCQEPVDEIWALLGLLPDRTVLEVQRKNIIDYSDSGKREYWKSYLAFMKVLYACEEGDFNHTILWTTEYPRHPLLPSWCPDFNVNSVDVPFAGFKHFEAGYPKGSMIFFTAELDSVNDALSINGFCVDEVRSVTSMFPGIRTQVCDRRQALWFEECEQLARKYLGESQEAIEALGEVLLASDQKGVDFSGNYANCYLCLREYGQSSLTSYSCSHEQSEMHIGYVAEVDTICANHKLFMTSNGRLGLGPAALQAGDKICVFTGATMLYVLRRTQDENLRHSQEQQSVQGAQQNLVQEKFSLIGQVYVRGLMYGEAFTADSRGPDCKLVIV